MPDLMTLIKERHSSRMPFEAEHPIGKQDLNQIMEAGRWAPTAHNMQNFQIIVVDDKTVLQAIGSVQHSVSDTFLQENYEQLSFSEEELLRKKVGLLGTMFPAAWRARGAGKSDAAAEGVTARPTPPCSVLLVVVYDPRTRAPASEGDFLGTMSLGCVMENMWLMAQSLGIGFQIVSSLSAGPAQGEVKSILSIPDGLRIAFAARLGYPIASSAKYLRVRREVDDFTYHNRFGNHGIA